MSRTAGSSVLPDLHGFRGLDPLRQVPVGEHGGRAGSMPESRLAWWLRRPPSPRAHPGQLHSTPRIREVEVRSRIDASQVLASRGLSIDDCRS